MVAQGMVSTNHALSNQGPVVQSLVSANRWLRGIKTYRFPWYLTLVSTNHASSNLGQVNKSNMISTHQALSNSEVRT